MAESGASAEITVKCKNEKVKSGALYAEINGQIFPCAQPTHKSLNKYYVSIAGPHKQIAKGNVVVKLFDGESYSELRKARTSEATKAVKPFGEITFYHPGVSSPWIQSEFFGAGLFGLLLWYAYKQRNKILA